MNLRKDFSEPDVIHMKCMCLGDEFIKSHTQLNYY